MVRLVVLSVALVVRSIATAQDQPVLQPVLEAGPDLSLERYAAFAEFDSLLNAATPLSPTGKTRLDMLYLEIGETLESPCDLVGGGCSWYCGGGPDTVWASSCLAASKERSYAAMNAHDLDACTVWCEGVAGPGVGEQLVYRFAPESPRLHTILVVNGLTRERSLWQANNRVRVLDVAENGVLLYTLALTDTMDIQRFKLPALLGKREDGLPLELSFTIRSVYPGNRHDDTVITEIYFDGTDVH
ncbi:MAG: hypothetical protein IPN85_15975 [Flavobacteriales bacterium]|nr:hypothetical protein [Flavobacteriales bacterium]MBL0034929.1 hypothetical protein [Flavobacteriales bacterium]